MWPQLSYAISEAWQSLPVMLQSQQADLSRNGSSEKDAITTIISLQDRTVVYSSSAYTTAEDDW